jgi:hypothetical protein
MNGTYLTRSVYLLFVTFFAALHAGRNVHAQGARAGLPTEEAEAQRKQDERRQFQA